MGLATPPRKTVDATETNIREQDVNGARNEEPQNLGIMTDDSQTQSGAGISKPDLLNPKSKLRIACSNVRTLYQTRKLEQIIREMENYIIEVLCVSEARWINSRRRWLSTGHTPLFSGRTDINHHSNGVTIIVNRMVVKTIFGVEAVHLRDVDLIKIPFYTFRDCISLKKKQPVWVEFSTGSHFE